jgi:hypothetical protein
VNTVMNHWVPENWRFLSSCATGGFALVLSSLFRSIDPYIEDVETVI